MISDVSRNDKEKEAINSNQNNTEKILEANSILSKQIINESDRSSEVNKPSNTIEKQSSQNPKYPVVDKTNKAVDISTLSTQQKEDTQAVQAEINNEEMDKI